MAYRASGNGTHGATEMPYNSETETFYQAPATVVDSTPDGDTVQEGFDDRLTPAMAGLYADLNLLKADGMISVGIPATTTSRGIARVATLADMEPGAVIENGPAVIAAKGGVVTTTPTPNAVPQADASGKLDGWVSPDANKANTSLDNITSSAKADIAKLGCPDFSRAYTFSMSNGSTKTFDHSAFIWLSLYRQGSVTLRYNDSNGPFIFQPGSDGGDGGTSGQSFFVPKGATIYREVGSYTGVINAAPLVGD